MSKRRTYSWNFKAEVLAVYEVDGPAATARLYKIPVRTIKSWATRMGLHTGAETKSATEAACLSQQMRRAIVRDLLIQRVQEMLERMDSPMKTWVGSGATPVEVEIDRPLASVCKDLATTAGILLDKFRLEMGEATGRSEVSVTDEDRQLVESDVARVIAEAEAAARDASG